MVENIPKIENGVSDMFNILCRVIKENPGLYKECKADIGRELLCMAVAGVEMESNETSPQEKLYAKASIIKLHMEAVLREIGHDLKF
jgi:hypothetical protein